MTRYVVRDGIFMEKPAPPPQSGGFSWVPDIQPFVTQDGVEITSRSHLRTYEQTTGSRQCGNDWTGSDKPDWWDSKTGSL